MYSRSPFLISLMATVASLPYFLFTLPAGVLPKSEPSEVRMWGQALAGGYDRRISGAWLAALLDLYTILVSVFLVGVGFVFNLPAWTSIVLKSSHTASSRRQTLSGLQVNLSGIIGPALGGFLLPPAWRILFLLSMPPVSSWLCWRSGSGNSQSRRQSFRRRVFSNLSGQVIRYVCYVPRLQLVLARNFLLLFLFQSFRH